MAVKRKRTESGEVVVENAHRVACQKPKLLKLDATVVNVQ
jgi:hypothetical protein